MDFLRFKDGGEFADCFFGRAFPREAFDGVVGDEVDFGAKFFGVLGKETGFFGHVVDAIDENVFKGDDFVFLGDVICAGVEEFVQRISFVDGHDFSAHGVGGSVQGDGQLQLFGLVGEFANAGDESTRGHGDMARADVESPWGVDDFDGGHEVFVIGKGFAHAHENEVVDFFAAVAFGFDNLGDYFRGGEVAAKALESARAKFASVGAAKLGGNAECVSIGFFSVEGGRCGDEDAFDVVVLF